ncbi:transglutaminase-like cysteine peptidase [Methylophaga sulfidovorans]|uniref:Predicted transglutaminase-like cysteine proteinase n=1 Tax=Methylophaga sulfidovorans TaxID=45496 RepID=A0A1I3ZBV9_9GAMM|nr:transglutaminase-like cysteine peptidase [Methylophaga sulfidovorans]SFK41594.1 Predicted transglutaminase-like cysteine proteinase [Methylophaga sulfidovorans]
MLFKRPLSLLLILTFLLLSLPLVADLNISTRVLDKIEVQYNKFARKRVEDWQKLVDENKDLPEAEKLELVNKFFNTNVLFIDDIDLWNKKDYWATPLEMLSIGGGDCEDYSIAKYFTLKELGVDEDKLRITYVKAKELNQAHMVLTYFKTKRSVPLVLDNLITDIKPATQRNDLTPVYSFNGTGLWLAKSRGEGQRVGGSSRLSLWQDLEKRMQQQAEEATSE